MKQNRNNSPAETQTPGGNPALNKKAWTKPEVIMSSKIKTLGYACNSGPAPTSGAGCPP